MFFTLRALEGTDENKLSGRWPAWLPRLLREPSLCQHWQRSWHCSQFPAVAVVCPRWFFLSPSYVGIVQQCSWTKIHSLSSIAQDWDGQFGMMPRRFDPHSLPSGHIWWSFPIINSVKFWIFLWLCMQRVKSKYPNLPGFILSLPFFHLYAGTRGTSELVVCATCLICNFPFIIPFSLWDVLLLFACQR